MARVPPSKTVGFTPRCGHQGLEVMWYGVLRGTTWGRLRRVTGSPAPRTGAAWLDETRDLPGRHATTHTGGAGRTVRRRLDNHGHLPETVGATLDPVRCRSDAP